MELETKFLRLHTAVTLGSRFGDWQVCWLGGWNKHRIGFMVMVVRVSFRALAITYSSELISIRRIVGSENLSTKSLLISASRVMNRDGAIQIAPEGTILNMKVFSITANNQVLAFASEEDAPAGEAVFGSAEQLAALVQQWPIARLVEVWNQLPGAKQIRKFTDRKSGARRLWQAVQGVVVKAGPQQRKAVLKRPAAAPTAKQSQQDSIPEKGTKAETILALLRQPTGATLTALMRATQWQAHSVRGFISGQLRKRMGLRVKTFRRDGDRVYRLRP